MKSENRLAGLGILTAISASLCCITPILALLAGTSGLASTFSWIEPFRPYLIGLTILVLGFAWYQKLKPIKKDNCNCEPTTKEKFIESKKFLGLITVFALTMLAFPYFSKTFYPTTEIKPTNIIIDKSSIQKTEFKVEGMTCESCEEHIKLEVNKLTGIISSTVSYKNGNAIIEFDNTKLDNLKIEEAINSTGYKVTDKK
ncbi:MAG: mercuric transport protein MerTP [Ferruginibacter sp.]|jgi:copper chaperone CopZ